ncbi:MAG: protein kinase, partial [Gemmatimonadales bacterium]|nr:protein kinase [Gemmatimonadales bacterium]
GAALGAERFLTEIRTTARLQHPHILPLLDSGDADGLLYYVMPLVTGETLRARLDRDRQLSIEETLRIAREVADALGHAHGQNVIHRDIKPENILLQDGHALVADFGIALAVQSAGGARMTQTGLSLGTPQYMSPEQAMGERAIDARSDIYALGAVTYEMLTGDPPFTGSSVQAIVAKVMTERPSPLHNVRDTVPEHVEAAVMRALAKLPADRFASAAEFSAALHSGQTSFFPVRAQRRGLDWRIALAGGVLLGAAIGIGWMSQRTPSRSGGLGQRQQLTFNGRTTDPAIAPAGDWVAFKDVTCQNGAYDRCTSTLLVQEVGSTQAVPIIHDAHTLSAPRWSHDGSQLVVSARLDSIRAGLFAIPRSGGVTRMIGPEGVFDTHPSGDTVLVLRPNRGRNATALFINLADGRMTDSVPVPLADAIDIAWSPDRRHIAANDAGEVLVVFDRSGKETARKSFAIRESIRWNVAGDAIIFFVVGAVKEDELIRVAVNDDGTISSPPTTLLDRVPTLYQGRFDLARQSGRMIFATGDAVTDLWTFEFTLGDPVGHQRTRGTTWYGPPAISPEGSTMYYGRGDALGDNLYALSLEDGREEALGAERFPFGTSVHMSADGRRIAFAHSTPDGPRMEGLELPSRRPFSQMAAGTAQYVWPMGSRGFLDLTGDGRVLQILDSIGGSWRALPAPDTLSIVVFGPNPEGTRAAIIVTSQDGAMLGTVSLTEWQFQPIIRWPTDSRDAPGALATTAVNWQSDGNIYFTMWRRADDTPSIWRVSGTGGVPEKVSSVLPTCRLGYLAMSLQRRLGACVARDLRSDVWTIEGIGNR